MPVDIFNENYKVIMFMLVKKKKENNNRVELKKSEQ